MSHEIFTATFGQAEETLGRIAFELFKNKKHTDEKNPYHGGRSRRN